MSKPDDKWQEIAGKLYRDQFPRPDNFANAYTTIDNIAKALADAWEAGRRDGVEKGPSVANAVFITSKGQRTADQLLREWEELQRYVPGAGIKVGQRVELGCAAPSCFCTGRCKRTAEEQEAYEKGSANLNRFVGLGK